MAMSIEGLENSPGYQRDAPYIISAAVEEIFSLMAVCIPCSTRGVHLPVVQGQFVLS